MMMVIDACNSGQALEAEEKRRGPMNSRGLAQLAYEKGMLILTASQSYQAALEVSRAADGTDINHGLLTFSLLEGLTSPTADTDADKRLIDREWLTYAVNKVPDLQLGAMRARNAENEKTGATKRAEIVFINNDDKTLPPEKRGLQTPRVFYRRETPRNPFIVAAQR